MNKPHPWRRDHGEAEFPEQTAHLWAWFCELDRTRTSNGFCPNPISCSEIIAWAFLSGRSLLPFETDLIVRIDIEYRRQFAESIESKGK